ncbi:MAG TPA: FAD-dependent oxidoreductase [Acidimicrobiia bacterium]|nr:FAD-dependent oxidoreductase [Acidimicrobiia bacterium]
MGLQLDLTYYDRNIPCLAACPVHTNAGAYVAAIADGDDLTAYLTARLPNPFASVCGRVCAAPCETACRRGEVDSPIAIRALKRFVTEKYGPESGNERTVAATDRPERKESVGIVGGGPAGLAAAHDLRLRGYQVTVYEATGILGGMMVLGIPEYRLDRALVQAEIDSILALGVEVKMNTRLGRDVTLEELRKRHDGVMLALGATLGRGLDIPGHEADGVLKAIEFLINVNQGYKAQVGEQVVVIGGGNVAMDAARTALRAAAYGDRPAAGIDLPPGELEITEAVDVARSAVRAGAKQVTVVALESPEEMPAAGFEIEEAMREGIRFVHRRGPQRIEVSDGRVTGLTTVKVLSVFDSAGRFAPTFEVGVEETLAADTVIIAIGQAIDIEALGGDRGPKLSPRRTIDIDDKTMATSLPKVWAAGDAAYGPRNLIDAIADGRKVAADIHRSFGGPVEHEQPGVMLPLRSFHRLSDLYDRIPRQEVPSLPTDRRIGLAEVELGFTEAEARAEASRCLRCFSNIQLDVDICVLCGLCVDVCPFDLISIVPAADFDPGARGTALLLDESKCIRCALCVERCPTKALSMSTWSGVGVLPMPVLVRSGVEA